MRINRDVVLWVVVIAAVGLLAACAGSAANEAQETQPPTPTVAVSGETLLNDRCVACHDLSKVTNTRQGREAWSRTVERMVSKGARLNAEEQSVLIDYLAESYGP